MVNWEDNFIFPNIEITSIKNNSITYSLNNDKYINLFSTISPIIALNISTTVLYNAKILISTDTIKKNTNFDCVIITRIDNNSENSNYFIKLTQEREFDTFYVDYIELIWDNNYINSSNSANYNNYINKVNNKPNYRSKYNYKINNNSNIMSSFIKIFTNILVI